MLLLPGCDGVGNGAGAGFCETLTLLLPDTGTALPSEADVTSPLNLITIVPSPVAVHDALNDLFVSSASSDASALCIVHPLTGPLAVTCTFQAADEVTYNDTVKLSPTYTFPELTDMLLDAA